MLIKRYLCQFRDTCWPQTWIEVLKAEIAVEHESAHSMVRNASPWLCVAKRAAGLLLNAETPPHAPRAKGVAVLAEERHSAVRLLFSDCDSTPAIRARITVIGKKNVCLFWDITKNNIWILLLAYTIIVYAVPIRGHRNGPNVPSMNFIVIKTSGRERENTTQLLNTRLIYMRVDRNATINCNLNVQKR